jgi:hypothetical protein
MFPHPVAKAVEEIAAALHLVVEAFDPKVVTATTAGQVLAAADRVEKMAACLKSLAAARVAEADASARGRRGGEGPAPSPAHRLANRTGTSRGAAKKSIDTGKRLEDQPALNSAARAGELSAEQTALVSEAAAANPREEQRLVDLARSGASLEELRRECARVRAAADRDAEARHARIRRNRFAAKRTNDDGSEQITCRGTADDIAGMWAAIEGYARTEFDKARLEGRRESQGAYAFDAMVEICRRAAAVATGDERGTDNTEAETPVPAGRIRKPVPTKVIVRVDLTALLRGCPVEGEKCEIAGAGEIPVSLVRELIATGDAFIAAVLTNGVDVLNVAHIGRKPTAFQQTALEWLSTGCDVLGCNNTVGLEIDHVDDWAETKLTKLSRLRCMCGHHHDLKTHKGWALVEGPGKQPLVPPEDPRHPKNKPKRSDSAA